LATGEAVFGNGFGITLEYGAPTPSSAGREVIWHRGEVGAYLPDAVSIAEADHDLAEAIRDTASLFSQRGTSTWLPNIASALSGARRAGEELHLPSNHPPRAVRLIAQAERLSIVLRVVDSDDTGELSATAMQDRVAALAPLRTTVRRGLLAGYNAAAEVASE
jgi:hypothetical protein